jgi:hypothetical protein
LKPSHANQTFTRGVRPMPLARMVFVASPDVGAKKRGFTRSAAAIAVWTTPRSRKGTAPI